MTVDTVGIPYKPVHAPFSTPDARSWQHFKRKCCWTRLISVILCHSFQLRIDREEDTVCGGKEEKLLK